MPRKQEMKEYKKLFISSVILEITIHMSYVVEAKHKNILFLASDDMRPNLGCYANSHPGFNGPPMHTPNLDALAARSLLLERAYAQQAICSPSRTSLLTGRRPDTTRVTDLSTYFRNVGGNFTTIPQYFKDHGYYTVGGGKIFHSGMEASGNDDPISWTEKFHHAHNFYPHNGKNNNSWQALTADQYNAHPIQDTSEAEYMIQKLREIAPAAMLGVQPFFLAFGVHKPHLPFNFPEEYLSFYPEEDVKEPENPYAPVNMPNMAWSNFGELRGYYDASNEAFNISNLGNINITYPNSKVREMRRAYYAALSYADYSLGQLLNEVRDLGLEDDTVIVFWGDHGWQLGEHAEWSKHTNFEIATHVPLMVSIPGLTDGGIRSNKLVELVDIFPTLIEATGFDPLEICPTDSSEINLCTEGSSLIPLMKYPSYTHWKDGVFWQYPRGGFQNHVPRCMGYSILTDHYHYTEWVHITVIELPKYAPDWDRECDHYELYDLKEDVEENINLYQNENYNDVQKELSKRLRAGWRNEVNSEQSMLEVTIEII